MSIFDLKMKKTKISIDFCKFEKVKVQISAKTNNFDFLEQYSQKRILPIKNRKNKHHHYILHIRISISTKFRLKQTILIFWTKFVQKGKINTTIEFHIFRLVWISNFALNKQFWISKFAPKLTFLFENGRSKHHLWILHIWISVGTKFLLKITILSFWTKFAPKGYFQSKTESCIFNLV